MENKYLFNATENAFYPYELRESYNAAGTWPEDGIDVDESVFLEFTRQAPEGKYRGADTAGNPAWFDIPPLTTEQLIQAAERDREFRIDGANGHMSDRQWPGKAAIGRLAADDLAEYNMWLDYLDALYAVDASEAPDIEWPTAPVS